MNNWQFVLVTISYHYGHLSSGIISTICVMFYKAVIIDFIMGYCLNVLNPHSVLCKTLNIKSLDNTGLKKVGNF